MSTEHTRGALQAAWADMIGAINRARDHVDSPGLHAPPPTEQGLAEGHRYVLGFLFSSIERACFEDPEFPYFRRAIQPQDKATIDNADALYLSARIDGTRSYRITGRVADHRHWSGAARASGPVAPQYIVFEAHSRYAGDTGSLMELAPGGRVVTGLLDSTDLVVDADGRFEILCAPDRPASHTGNFIATRKDGTDTAQYLIVRSLFHDWANEVSPELRIVPIARGATHPVPAGPDATAAALRRVGELVEHQMRFWNEFYDIVLESNGDKNGDGVTFMPHNGLNEPAAANLSSGGGQSTNVYSGGVFELDEDEALLVELTVPVDPAYLGFHLSNVWGESLDYANHVSSLNAFQTVTDPDGVRRYVIAHRDPGVPNWLDTVGHRTGFLTVRWTYPKPPEQMPTTAVHKLALSEVRGRLPSGTPTVSPEQRAAQIELRQEHVARRYRQY
ncbi:MAG: hypothetical protein EKK34_30750 [Mycobacterium sp.]|nr:MAG: hypothetical protein EKK34_30750 [Mycobacterium sp.]